MSCPTDAQLRTHLDDTDGVVATHVTDCRRCARQLTTMRADAQLAANAIAGLGDVSEVDVDAAWRAVTPTGASAASGAVRVRAPLSIAAGIMVFAVAALVAFTPTGRQAAAGFLSGFRAERFEVVTFDPDQPMARFEELGEIVDVRADQAHGAPVEVDDLAAAAEVSGFAPSAPTSLPDGAVLRSVQASEPGTLQLALRADQAPDLPDDLDGAQVTVAIPGMVASTYDVDGRMLVVGEAGQVAVDAEGAELADIRSYLLSRPEVPDDLASQLLAINDWTTTIPIPVPVDQIVWRDTTVGDAPGLMLSDPLGSGLLWQADGRIHAVGGEGLDIDAVRDVADGLG